MIALIDYDAGNIKSVINALDDLNAEYILTNTESEIISADKIILPGVGEAAFAMEKLTSINIIKTLKNFDKPFLGICLGLQLLGSFSDERNTKCLDILPALVKKFDNTNVKVPHMGWNNVEFNSGSKLFNGIKSGEFFYFANSYYMEMNEFTIGTTNYDIDFTAIINKNNFYGVQFHPEKSGKAGLQLIQNFIKL